MLERSDFVYLRVINYYEIKHKGAAIYAIKNLIDGKKYVGSSFDFNNRKQTHRNALERNKHRSIKLQRAWNKYGGDRFELMILQYCKPSISELKKYEKIWIDFYDSYKHGYNVSPTPFSQKGIKRSRSTVEKLRRGRLGKIASLETRKRLSKSHIGIQLGRNHGYSKPVAQYDLSGNLISEYDCARDVTRKTGIDFRNVSDCCRGNRQHHRGFIFIFVKKNKVAQKNDADMAVATMKRHIDSGKYRRRRSGKMCILPKEES